MNRIKKENTAVLEKFRKKKGIIFDIDNTLLDTHPLFTGTYEILRQKLVDSFGDRGDRIMDTYLFNIYNRKGKDKGIVDMRYHAKNFSKYIVEEGLIKNTESEREIWEKPLLDIYQSVPDFLDGAEELLKYLYNKGYKIGFCTHSGDWGDLKSKAIWERLDFPEEELVYFSIPLEEKKDSVGWAEAVKHLALEVEEIAVVGDNWEADIVASQEIGVDACVWFKYSMPKETNLYNEIERRGYQDQVVLEITKLSEIQDIF